MKFFSSCRSCGAALAIVIGSVLLLAGCAGIDEDTEWRAVEPASRAIVFAANSFGMNESVYTGTDISFVQRYEYGVWRAEGGAGCSLVVELLRSRPGGNYAFSTPAKLMRDMVAEAADEPPKAYGDSGTLKARFGDVETLGYQRGDNVHCTAFRWFGWGLGGYINMRDGGNALGTARMEANYCAS